MSLKPIPPGPLRQGYTTGACATAAAKAALLSLLRQEEVREVTITLPRGEKQVFRMESCRFTTGEATCATRKDAGDDPDVTHRALIGCRVALNGQGEVRFLRGQGVGLVTLPGLPVRVGEPAINPVPRQMIQATLAEVLAEVLADPSGSFAASGSPATRPGVDVTVFVPEGEVLARKTLNARLGIVGGISILGTTGIVQPFSAASYLATIRLGIEVCLGNGCREVVLNAGARSESRLRRLFPHLPGFAFIQFGNWIGESLTCLRESVCERVHLGIMLGKAVKLARGDLDTHSSRGTWDPEFLVEVARDAGYGEDMAASIRTLTLARGLGELIPFRAAEPFYARLAALCHAVCDRELAGKDLEIVLLDEDGEALFHPPRKPEDSPPPGERLQGGYGANASRA